MWRVEKQMTGDREMEGRRRRKQGRGREGKSVAQATEKIVGDRKMRLVILRKE